MYHCKMISAKTLKVNCKALFKVAYCNLISSKHLKLLNAFDKIENVL